MTTAETVLLIGGYYFPTSRLDVWLMSVPAMPVLGDLVSYTVAPYHIVGHFAGSPPQDFRAPVCPADVQE